MATTHRPPSFWQLGWRMLRRDLRAGELGLVVAAILLAVAALTAVGFFADRLQAGLAGLPFGGVGESGMGRAHGEDGFLALSHRRSVLRRPFWLDLPLRYPPYAGKLPWLERLRG